MQLRDKKNKKQTQFVTPDIDVDVKQYITLVEYT